MNHAPTLLAIVLALPLAAAAATPQEISRGYAPAASPERGQALFTGRHGREWTCASCHTANPTVPGRHAGTGKFIEPLAPAANPARLVDAARVEKWLRRNCNDVLGRECTPQEKADVTAWLMALKP